MHELTQPLLRVQNLHCAYGARAVVRDISLDLWPGEVLAIVGESGSGKTTLLNSLAARHAPTSGTVAFAMQNTGLQDIYALSEAQARLLARTDWGFVHQHAADGLRMNVSATLAPADTFMRRPATGWRGWR